MLSTNDSFYLNRTEGEAGKIYKNIQMEAFTDFTAASSRSEAVIILTSLESRIRLPSSTFVPSSRTTSGTFRETSLAALTIQDAITSQRMMPPKMFTRMALTCGSDVKILKAATTCSSYAFPPTSKKFAGLPPRAWIMSIVAMARPAPLTMQPMEPSKPI